MSDHQPIVGQRSTWRFPFKSAAVAAAARAQGAYHKERLDFWDSEHEKAIKELEKATVVIERYQQTGGERVSAAVDQRPAMRVSECEGKMTAHRKQMEDFERWATALEAEPSLTMSLDVDDVHFFRLGGLTAADKGEDA